MCSDFFLWTLYDLFSVVYFSSLKFKKGLRELGHIFEKLKLCMSCSVSSIFSLKFKEGLHELRNIFEKLKLCLSCSVSSILAL